MLSDIKIGRAHALGFIFLMLNLGGVKFAQILGFPKGCYEKVIGFYFSFLLLNIFMICVILHAYTQNVNKEKPANF